MATIKGVWVFNSSIDGTVNGLAENEEMSVSFTSNGTQFSSISFDTVQESGLLIHNLFYGDTLAVEGAEGNVSNWQNEAYKTVDFGTTEQEVSDDFLSWMQENATQQASEGTTPTAESVKADLQSLVTAANAKTGNNDTTIKQAIVTLMNGYGQGGDSPLPIEVSTEDEMTALLETAEVGSIYKYTGETTDTYENGALYLVSVKTSGDKNFRTLIVGSSVIGNLPAIGTSLEDCTWEEISAISAAGKGAEYFKVGDTKSVYIKGTVGTLAVDTTLYVYILGFDHNKDITGNTGITFGTFKKANGLDVALCDSKYDTSVTSGGKYFNMNHFGGYNYGGWAASDLRYDILGSTDVAPSGYGSVKTTSSVGYDASPTCAIKPVANTLMAALPTDLRAVMKPMTIYTDNTGNKSDIEANVTATIDYLPLLADFEIFGKRNYSNTYEQNKQAQYTYFVAGNSKKKYKHTDTSASSFSNLWWERSASYFGNESFCFVDNVGTANGNYARMSYGLAPIFLV